MPAYHFQRIEPKWQAYWQVHQTFRAHNFAPDKPKLYVLDMFPYPSAAGLHVGHPEGYTATDIVCRYKRMRGYNVLHPMGWDAFGLPAEQYAIRTGTHPRTTTGANVDNFRRQINALGFSYDWAREIDTTDPAYYKWTQWIFLQIFDTWYDPDYEWTDPQGRRLKGKGRPISELPIPPEWAHDPEAYRDSKRLAYRALVPVNWCAELGTVLANEEVIDGKSEIGGHPVVRIPLKQWMLRITAYAERLLDDLELVDWPRAIKDMQRNWIGRSEGAEVDFPLAPTGARSSALADAAPPAELEHAPWITTPSAWRKWQPAPDPDVIRVYTTRPDTLFGATYMVLSPEHPLVDRITTQEHRASVEAYRQAASKKSELDRTDLARAKTGVFTGASAINPVNGWHIPIWIADYVLMGYGTGAIMAVPGHDERDFEFARQFHLPIIRVVTPGAEPAGAPLDHAEVEDGISVNSHNASIRLDGLPTPEAKAAITGWLQQRGLGRKAINYKLRDWLFSRQRYWGEPFPIVLDQHDRALALPESELPVLLPELDDFRPTGSPEPPLSKAKDWVRYSETLQRETNTMPQWAGSCWYFLRYLDPNNDLRPWDPQIEKYWMPVDLYVGGAEHAVLHLLYSRFWHKLLFDRQHVSTPEPFQRLVNQGMILGETEYTAYQNFEGQWISASDAQESDAGPVRAGTRPPEPLKPVKLDPDQVAKQADALVLASDPHVRVESRAYKMSKSRGNVITPDDVVEEYGADSLRLYEMFMGPLEAVKPWSMKGVEGVYRFLGRAWRMIVEAEAEVLCLDRKVQEVEPTLEQAKVVARTAAAVTDDLEAMRFNTAISRLMEFVNYFTGQDVRPKRAMETFTLLLSPMAPHVAEELWSLLGHPETLAYERWPTFDPALLKDETVEIPVQINGKLRGRVVVAADADRGDIERAAWADPRIASLLQSKKLNKIVIVPGKLVNFVVAGG